MLHLHCDWMRAAEHAPRGLFRFLHRLNGLAEIVERRVVVGAERPRVILLTAARARSPTPTTLQSPKACRHSSAAARSSGDAASAPSTASVMPTGTARRAPRRASAAANARRRGPRRPRLMRDVAVNAAQQPAFSPRNAVDAAHAACAAAPVAREARVAVAPVAVAVDAGGF